jgi:hypothetical protein
VSDEAKKLIKEFAAKLLALNNGEAIPRQWKNALLKAIKLAPKKRGRKPDCQKIAAISKELTFNRGRLAAPDRTIKDKRGEVKKAIADSQETSIRDVERIAKKRRQLLDGSANGRPLDAAMTAIIDGIAQCMDDEITAEHRAGQAAKSEAMRRTLGIRTFPEWKVFAIDNFQPHHAIYFDNRLVATKADLLRLIKEMEAAQKSVK